MLQKVNLLFEWSPDKLALFQNNNGYEATGLQSPAFESEKN